MAAFPLSIRFAASSSPPVMATAACWQRMAAVVRWTRCSAAGGCGLHAFAVEAHSASRKASRGAISNDAEKSKSCASCAVRARLAGKRFRCLERMLCQTLLLAFLFCASFTMHILSCTLYDNWLPITMGASPAAAALPSGIAID
eukprot:599865-Prymnesium_polylepis.2